MAAQVLATLHAVARGEQPPLTPEEHAHALDELAGSLEWIGRDRHGDAYMVARAAVTSPATCPAAVRCIVAVVGLDANRFVSPDLIDRVARPIMTGAIVPSPVLPTWMDSVRLIHISLHHAQQCCSGQPLLQDAGVMPMLRSLLECVRDAVRTVFCAPTCTEADERVKPLCEVLKSLHDVLPDPRRAAEATVAAATATEALGFMVPIFGTVLTALIEACEAEAQRPKRQFAVINATWKLVVRMSSIAPLPRLAAAATLSGRREDAELELPRRLLRCLLRAVERAFADELAASSAASALEAAKVVQFYTDKLKLVCAAYAPWLLADTSAPGGDCAQGGRSARTICLCLSGAYASLTMRPITQSPHPGPNAPSPSTDLVGGVVGAVYRRKVRATLDACVLSLLSATADGGVIDLEHPPTPGEVGGSCRGGMLEHWASLSMDADVIGGMDAPTSPEQQRTAFGLLMLHSAALRAASRCGAPSVQRLAGRIWAQWLRLLPHSYAALLAPRTSATAATPSAAIELEGIGGQCVLATGESLPVLRRLLSEAATLASSAPQPMHASMLAALVDGGCRPHLLTRRAAVELWPFALRALPAAAAAEHSVQLLLAAEQLERLRSASAAMRHRLLALVAASVPVLSQEACGQLLGRVHSALLTANASKLESVPCELASSPSWLVAVELLEALADQAPSAAAGALEAHSAPQWLAILCARVSNELNAMHGICDTEACGFALRGLTALLTLLPAAQVPSGVSDSLSTCLPRLLAAAEQCPSELCARTLETAAAGFSTLTLRSAGAVAQAAVLVLRDSAHSERCARPLIALAQAICTCGFAEDDAIAASASLLVTGLLAHAFPANGPAPAPTVPPAYGGHLALQDATIALAADAMSKGTDQLALKVQGVLPSCGPDAWPMLSQHLGRLNNPATCDPCCAPLDLEQRTALSATAQSEAAEAAEAEAASKASAETQLSRAAKRAKQQEPAGAAAERGLGMLESGIATLRKAAVSGLSAKVRAALNKHVAQVHALCVG